MLEITTGGLQDVSWEKTLDENSRKTVYADFNQVMQQVMVVLLLLCFASS